MVCRAGKDPSSEKGLKMKKVVVLATAVAAMSAASAMAADMPVKALKAPPVVSPWDLAFGAAIMNDYNFRGISQSNHKASVAEYQELRYNWNSSLQSYIGLSGESISFPNSAAAEIDFYGGIRPTFGPLAFDLGIWYYYYPGGRCQGGTKFCPDTLPNGNTALGDVSFIEYYGKTTWNVNDSLAIGVNEFYDPDWLASGQWGNFAEGTIKYTLPSTVALPLGAGMYLSGEVGHYWFGGTLNPFLQIPALGVGLPGYTTWNAGLGFTWKTFTLDLRYYDTDLSKANCNYLTGDQTAGLNSKTGFNESTWCGSAFVAKFAFDLTLANLK
jgi:uncharacterized protein (TIGR02001 family)